MKRRKNAGKRDTEIRKAVREGYAKIAREQGSCCGPAPTCGGGPTASERIAKEIGYSDAERSKVPEGSNLGLGCGNPTALASLRAGETVLDLGSGAGFDCFLAANRVGRKGKVIGVDMTPEMLDRARANARKGGYDNVEFRLGEIENLPAADGSVDVVISNCVINLAPDKRKVFEEAFRVLRAGGRMMISDIVLRKELPKEVTDSIEAYVGCVSGAMKKDEYLALIRAAGFKDVEVVEEKRFHFDLEDLDPEIKTATAKHSKKQVDELAGRILSISIRATK